MGLCWFSSKDSLIVFFIVPFVLIMSLNLVFFLMSGYFVWETSRSTAKITTSGPKTNFYLYTKLATLMGLSWVTGVSLASHWSILITLSFHWSLLKILSSDWSIL